MLNNKKNWKKKIRFIVFFSFCFAVIEANEQQYRESQFDLGQWNTRRNYEVLGGRTR